MDSVKEENPIRSKQAPHWPQVCFSGGMLLYSFWLHEWISYGLPCLLLVLIFCNKAKFTWDLFGEQKMSIQQKWRLTQSVCYMWGCYWTAVSFALLLVFFKTLVWSFAACWILAYASGNISIWVGMNYLLLAYLFMYWVLTWGLTRVSSPLMRALKDFSLTFMKTNPALKEVFLNRIAKLIQKLRTLRVKIPVEGIKPFNEPEFIKRFNQIDHKGLLQDNPQHEIHIVKLCSDVVNLLFQLSLASKCRADQMTQLLRNVEEHCNIWDKNSITHFSLQHPDYQKEIVDQIKEEVMNGNFVFLVTDQYQKYRSHFHVQTAVWEWKRKTIYDLYHLIIVAARHDSPLLTSKYWDSVEYGLRTLAYLEHPTPFSSLGTVTNKWLE